MWHAFSFSAVKGNGVLNWCYHAGNAYEIFVPAVVIPPSSSHFDRHYQSHLKHLKLKGLQPKAIEAYLRAIRRIGDYGDHQIDRLTDYFSDLAASHSWSTI